MPLTIDHGDLLKALAARPEAFASLIDELGRKARDLVAKRLKDRATGLDDARRIGDALPEGALGIVLEGLTEADASRLAARFDPLNATLKELDEAGRRTHLVRLCRRDLEPSESTSRTSRPRVAPRKKKSTAGDFDILGKFATAEPAAAPRSGRRGKAA